MSDGVMTKHFIGIDVGTGSARAGLFDELGRLLASTKAEIALWHEAGSIVEQSSSDIWRAVCTCVREAMLQADISSESVDGIGFDATYSLVVLGPGGEPLPAGPSGDPDRNIMVWMDHRATEQARRINSTGESVLDYVGGAISPEMETPKLLWLAEVLPRTFTPVAAGLIDAHAGGNRNGRRAWRRGKPAYTYGVCLGTSACSMSTTVEPAFVQGVWGPYFSAMVPGLWLSEGGQSAAGAAIDHLIRMHLSAEQAAKIAREAGASLSRWLSLEAERRGGAAVAAGLIGDLHVVPEFLGNRAPFADPDARGVIAGLGMQTDVDSLIALYLAGIFGLGYGARQIFRSFERCRRRMCPPTRSL
jgi:ribulose kinase